jgi:hypothetical protein
MNAKPINISTERLDILRAKSNYGIWYGAVLGLAFAVFCWGIDSYVLSNYHGMLPWLKFGIGAVLCTLPGGLTGWISAKVNKPLYSILFWLAAASIFAWLTVNLPLVILPNTLTILNPQLQGLLHYVYFDDFSSRVIVAFTWIAIFVGMAGLLQIPLSDSAVFSTSIMGKLGPLFITVILMSISGIMVDNGLVNEPLRSSSVAIDNTIQFVADNRGKEVDKSESRRMHAGAFSAVNDSVTEQRQLVVSGYDGQLGQINVLIRFERDWVECLVVYNQPSFCKVVELSP